MWQVIGASVQGSSHVQLGTPCQDSHGYQVLEKGVIAAVADGLGSAERSEEGSKLAAEGALDALKITFQRGCPTEATVWEETFKDVFSLARLRLEKAAHDNHMALREFGTTLLVVAITEDWFVVGQLGDGAVVALFEDGRLETVSCPQRGEYANETIPLTAENAVESMFCIAQQTPVKAVGLLTDGLQNLSINLVTGRPFVPFFTPFFEAIVHELKSEEVSKELGDFLNSERILKKTDDDKTLVVVGRISPCNIEHLSNDQ